MTRPLLLTLLGILASPVSGQGPCSCLANTPPGTDLLLGDDETRTINLPFAFPFDGVIYTEITVDSNGRVFLGSGGSSDFSPTENELLAGDPVIALYWDDWSPNNAAAGDGVFFAADTTSACVVFRNVPSFGGAEALTGEVVLSAGGEIYLTLDAAVTQQNGVGIVGISAGNGAPSNPLDLSLLPAIAGATGYEVFDANNPLDLAGSSTELLPTGAADYALAAASLGACAPGTYPPLSSSSPYGTGCGGSSTDGAYYEHFAAGAVDLSGLSIRFSATGPTAYSVAAGGGFDTSYAPADAFTIGDDSVVTQPLGFALDYDGVPVTDVGVCANGFVWMDGSTSGDFTDTVAELLSQGPRVAPLWDDLQPNAAGTVYWTQGAGFAMVTWEGVPYWGTTDLVTVQCKFFDTGDIEFNYGTLAANPSSATVGLAAPGASDPGPRDVSLATGLVDLAPALQPLSHTVVSGPRLGSDYALTVDDCPSATTIIAFAIGFQQLNNDLTALGAPGCFELASQNGVLVQLGSGPSASDSLFIPNLADFGGVSIYTQAAAFAPGFNPLGIVTSNGVEGVIGL